MAQLKQFKMARDYILRTTKGHTVRFKANEPRGIPRSVEDDAMRFGAIPVDMEEHLKQQQAAAEAEEKAALEPDEPRDLAIRRAITEIIEENDSKKFTASGQPKVQAVAKHAELKEVTAVEIDEIFTQLMAEKEG